MTTYTVLQLVLLILTATFGLFHTARIFIAASVLKLLSSISMIPLTAVEHNRSPPTVSVIDELLALVSALRRDTSKNALPIISHLCGALL